MLKNTRILITGSESFLGKAVSKVLKERGAIILTSPRHEVDFEDKQQTIAFFADCDPDYVINLAGYNGGLKLNKEQPCEIFDRNLRMNLNIHLACSKFGVQKLANILSSCAYGPAELLKEEEFDNSMPHPSVACHGLAKRALYWNSKFYHQEYGLNSINLCLTHIFGPEMECGENGKILGILIKKIVDAKDDDDKEGKIKRIEYHSQLLNSIKRKVDNQEKRVYK